MRDKVVPAGGANRHPLPARSSWAAILSLLLIAALVLVALPAPLASATPAQAVTVTLMHNNDGESKLINAGSGLEDFGGVARFKTVVENVRAEIAGNPNHVDILVTSGDNFLAGPEWSASQALPEGEPIYDAVALDSMNYDAMAIGNHDFDFGPDVTAQFIGDFTASQVPFLSANLDVSGEPALLALQNAGRIAASVVIEKEGEEFGIVGAITPNLPFISSPRNVVVDPDVAGAIQAEVDDLLAQGVDKIILISHLQAVSEDVEMAAMLSGVDVMVAGGGDEVLANDGDLLVPGDSIQGPYPIIAQDADGNDVPVVTTAGDYKYVGRLDVTFDANGDVTAIGDASGPIRVAGGSQPDAVEPDPYVQANVVEPVQVHVADLAANVIAQSEVALDGRRNWVRSVETNEGNLVADSLLWKAQQLAPAFGAPMPQVALQNGGGIRNNNVIAPGDFTELNTFSMLPFANFLTVVHDLTPENFLDLLENAVGALDAEGLPTGSGTGRFAQIAGFSFTFDSREPSGSRVISAMLDDGTPIIIDGLPVNGAPNINVATIDFLARGGDQYDAGFAGKDFTVLGASYQEALSDYIVAPTFQGGLGGLITREQYPEGGEARSVNLVPTTLTLMHHNDAESQLINAGSSIQDFGGIARMKSVIDNVRADVAADPDRHFDILLTSGDNFLASPELTASFERPEDEPIYDALGLDTFGYDVLCLGNHDFDFGPDFLARFISDFSTSQPPFLGANMDFSGEPLLQALVDEGRIAGSALVEKGNSRFGIVGAITPNLPFISSPRNVVVDPDVAGAVQAEIDGLLAQGINQIIFISHLQGLEEDLELASVLSGVDIMVAGGGDNLLANPGDLLVPGDTAEGPYPVITTDADGRIIYVVTGDGNYKYLGRFEATFDAEGEIISVNEETSGPVRVAGGDQPDAVEPDPFVQENVVEPVQEFVSGLASNVIAQSEVALDGRRNSVRGRETNEGNLLVDAMLWTALTLYEDYGAAKPDVAMTNGGGIRNGTIIPPGPFTELQTFDIAPFPNFVSVVANVSPEDFLALLENAVSRIDPVTGLPAGEGTGRFAQVSGFRFAYNAFEEPGSRVVDVILDDGTVMVENGKIAPTARSLNVTTVDFLARGGDEWDIGFQGRPFVNIGRSYQQALAEYIEAPTAEGGLGGLISAEQYPEGGEGRILQVMEPTTCWYYDFNNDWEIDTVDISMVAVRWMCDFRDECYDVKFDVSPFNPWLGVPFPDGLIDIVDISATAVRFGEMCGR